MWRIYLIFIDVQRERRASPRLNRFDFVHFGSEFIVLMNCCEQMEQSASTFGAITLVCFSIDAIEARNSLDSIHVQGNQAEDDNTEENVEQTQGDGEEAAEGTAPDAAPVCFCNALDFN